MLTLSQSYRLFFEELIDPDTEEVSIDLPADINEYKFYGTTEDCRDAFTQDLYHAGGPVDFVYMTKEVVTDARLTEITS